MSKMIQFSELQQARSGGTGRRAGLKIQWYLVPCGFDPLLRDHLSLSVNLNLDFHNHLQQVLDVQPDWQKAKIGVEPSQRSGNRQSAMALCLG